MGQIQNALFKRDSLSFAPSDWLDDQVSHDFLPMSYNVPGISSSVHLTVEGGGEKYGDSVPAVFFHPQVTSSHFCNT